MKRITQFILCIVLAVSAYGQGVGGNSVPRTVSGISAALDLISSTQGTVFYRGASGWEALPPGTSGQLFSTQGAAANPIWVTATGGAGDVNGPTLGTATDNAIVRFDGTGGKTIQNSAVTVADTTGAMTWSGDATLSGGSSGASLVLGQGASGAIALSPKGTSSVSVSNTSLVGSVVLGAGAEIYGDAATTIISSYGSRPMRFYLNGSEKAQFAPTTGNLLIGTTTDMASTAGGLTVAATGSGATATAVNTGGLRSANFGLSTVSGGASYFGGNVTAGGSITAGGGLTVSGSTSSFGGASRIDVGLWVVPTALAFPDQFGIGSSPTFTSAATSSGAAGYFKLTTAAGAYTMASGRGVLIDPPTLGAGSSITDMWGLRIWNQGAAGITNAYGIDIAAQSGAATTNIGLRNLGATVLATPASAVSLATDSTMTFELTSNTSLTIKVRGTDGTTRSVALTLAP